MAAFIEVYVSPHLFMALTGIHEPLVRVVHDGSVAIR